MFIYLYFLVLRNFLKTYDSGCKLTSHTIKYWHIVQEVKEAFRAKNLKLSKPVLKNPLKRVNFTNVYSQSTMCLNLKEISSITAESFTKFRNLTALSIVDTNIETIEANSFLGLNKLTHLDILSCLKFRLIVPGAFSGLAHLERLNINQSALCVQHMGKDTFKGLERLTHLTIQNCEPYEDCGLENLECENRFALLKSLTELSLTYVLLPFTLDEHFFHGLASLETIYLYHNKVNSITLNALQGLTNLHTFHSSFNELEILNLKSFSQLPKLKCLIFRSNSIFELKNKMPKKSPEIGTLSQYFPSLEAFELSENRYLFCVKRTYFHNMSNMRRLHLVHNSISWIQSNAFVNLTNLTYLCMNSNLLHVLKASMFTGLSKLEILDLSCNRIFSVENGCFDSMLCLTKLDLSENALPTDFSLRYKGQDIFSSTFVFEFK